MSQWHYEKLSVLTTKIGSGATPRGGKDSYHSSGIPLIRSLNVHFDGFRYEGLAHLNEKQAFALRAVEVRGGDVLLNITGASIGRVAVAPAAMNGARVNQHVCIIRPVEHLDSSFLRWYLSSPETQNIIFNLQSGATRQALTKEKILDFEVPVPTLAQQKWIVAEIEKQFSRLDEAVANLKRVKANLKRYKAAVLRAAVEGRIITDNSDQWQKTTIGEVAERVTKGSSPNWQGFDYAEKGIVFVRSQNVGWGTLDLSDIAHLPPTFNDKEKKSILKVNDVLLNIVGASIGRAAVATDRVEGGNINQAVSVIRPLKSYLMPKFLMYYLLSDKAQKLIHSQKVDVARANYSLDQIKKMPLDLPPIAVQNKIIAEVESSLSVIAQMDVTADLNLNRAERLRQAILSKAFSGSYSE